VSFEDAVEIAQLLDEATDELAEVLADFNLPNEELIKLRDIIQKRIEKAQMKLLKICKFYKIETS